MFDKDRNLLFGILAIQLRGIPSQKIMELAAAWAVDPSKDLPARLQDANLLTEDECRHIQNLVESAIRAHNGDVPQTLASFGAAQSIDGTKLDSMIYDLQRAETATLEGLRHEQASGTELGKVGVDETPGRYTGASEYARGGMGRVLLVHDEHLGRDVALKELLPLPPGHSEEPTPVQLSMSLLARFLQEARITGQLEHPSIVPVYELGRRRDGALYYTMKLVRGKTMADAVRACSSLEERLRLLPHFVDLCQAIAYAHSRGVIHRDIKPNNVMIGEFGETVVLDWGLAKSKGKRADRDDALEETLRRLRLEGPVDVDQTSEGRVLGTPSYMPPEQARGELSLVDECSDAYSLGAVLYELLTGKRPFTGTRASDVLQKVLRDVPEPVRTLEPDTPPELAAICEKAMARDRDRRYANARELAEETQRFLSGALVGAYHYSPAEHLRRLIARHKVLFSVAAAFTVLLIVVSLAYTWSLSRKNVELAASRAEEHAQRLDAESAREVAVEAQDEAERNAYLAQIRLASEYADSRNHASARETLWETPSRLRNWEWGYLLNRCNQDLFTLEGCRLVRYSPDGEHLATLSLAEPPRVWNADDGSLAATMESLPVRYLALAYSPDGSKIAAGAVNGAVMVWDAQSGKVNHTLKTLSGSAADVQFSPDGQFVYSASTEGSIIRWNAETGESTATAQTEGNEPLRSVQVSPDGAHVLAGLDQNRYIVLNAGTLETRWSFEGVAPSFNPNADTILLARGTGALRLETSTGEPLGAAFDHGANVLRARGDGQGMRIVTIGADSTAKIWNVAAGTVESVIALDGETNDAVFSPSGNPLLTYGSDGAIQLWDSVSGAPLASFDGHSASITSAEFSRDARTFATESRDDTVKVWQVSGPIGKRTLYRSPEALNALSIDRAGPRIGLAALTGRCIVLDLQTGAIAAEFGSFSPHLDAAIALQPNADRAVMLADNFCPMVYDFREHRIVTPYFGHGGVVRFLSFSPDGQHVASCGEDKTAQLWDAETGETRVVFEGHDDTVYSVVFSPDGESLLTASGDTTARRWNATSGGELTAYQGHTDIVTFAQFSADAQRVVTGAADGTARVWDAESGRELLVLGGNQPDVGAAVFSADGSRIFTGGTDGLVKVWDASTGAQLDAYTDHSDMVRTLELGRADNQILSASLDGAAFLWEAAPLYGPGKANRTDPESRDDYNRYRREAYASRQTASIETAPRETQVLVSTDAFRENLARLATLARSQGQAKAPDSLGDGVLIAGDADGKAFSMLGLSPGDRIIGIGETLRADSGRLADALEAAAGEPMPIILHVEGKRTRQIRLMPIDVHSEHREVVTSKDAATKLLKRLQDLLVANETMLEDVRRRNALARGEIQGPTESILGFWLVASPGAGDAGDLPDLGLAGWDRIIAINGRKVHSILEVIDNIGAALDSESAEALRSYSFEVERGEFRRVTITLLTE